MTSQTDRKPLKRPCGFTLRIRQFPPICTKINLGLIKPCASQLFGSYWFLRQSPLDAHKSKKGSLMKTEAILTDYAVHTISPIGAMFGLVLPVAPPQRKVRLRILVVDDDEADIYLIRRALANNPRVGEVLVARDGVEALELIDAGWANPDLAIVDLRMPRKDGLALLRDFASRTAAPFPAIVLTSSRAGADVYRSKKRGAIEFLTKPNSVEKLTAALDQVISTI